MIKTLGTTLKFFRLDILVLLAFLSGTVSVMANPWKPIRAELGVGGASCTQNQDYGACIVFRCDPSRGLEFVVFRDLHVASVPNAYELRVDTGSPVLFVPRRIEGVEGQINNLDHGATEHSRLLVEMMQGQKITLKMEQDFSFALVGARDGIERAISACSTREYAVLKSVQDVEDVASGAEERNPLQTYVKYLYNTDSWGRDLDGGLTNPSLRGITASACVQRCVDRQECTAITYNKPKQVCFLKEGLGSIRTDRDASTVVLSQRPLKVRKPLIQGPAPTFVRNLRARAGEPWQNYVSALRQASVPLGGNCQQEANELARVAQSISLKPPAREAKVDSTISLEWTADQMQQRIPAWLILSIDRPARFEGDGFFALNKGALGPFGLTHDADRQRAFVPLFEGESALNGALGLRALEAGDYSVRLTLMGYLRACSQEMPIMQSEWTISVTPADPQVVIRDLSAPHPFDQRLDVPEFARRVVFNDNIFQIQNQVDGSEILTRGGKNLRLSPTKRFVVVTDQQRFEIIDIVDGQRVGEVPGAALAFWNADSFYVSEMGFWGQISAGSTMRPRVFLETYETGPSCCMNGGNTELTADIENNLFRVAGQTWSLLDGRLTGTRDPIEYFPDRKFLLGKGFLPQATASLGMVAPVSQDEEWNMPLGPNFMYGYAFGNIRKSDDPEDAAIASMATNGVASTPNPEFGRNPIELANATLANTVLRAKAIDETELPNKGFEAALARWDVLLAKAVSPKIVLNETDFELPYQGTLIPGPKFLQTVSLIERDLVTRGIPANWVIPTPDNNDGYCNHFGSDGPDPSRPGASYELNLAYRFDLNGDPVWVTRARCDGGATGGSLTHATQLIVYDARMPGESFGDYAVEGARSMFGSRRQGLIDIDFKTKLFKGKLLVTYAPGLGALMVYDLSKREFVLQIRNSRRGDLMSDVFVDDALKHLFQLNLDGSFSVYRFSDNGLILEGRYLDDELVVWTADFRFDATEEGASFVELRFPGKAGQYSFQQFSGALRVPHLMRSALNSQDIASPPQVPGIPPELSAHIHAQGREIVAFVDDLTGQDAKVLRLYQDGLLTDTFTPASSGVFQVKATRRTGTRWATLVAENSTNLFSLPVSVDLSADPQGRSSTFFLGVGIDYYQAHDLNSLNYAKIDAIRLSDSLSALNGKTHDIVDKRILVDRRATKKGILEAVDALIAQANPGDNLVLFFAGHGLKGPNGDFYLGLSDTDPTDLEGTALDWNALAARFENVELRVTVLLDACHAGAAGSSAFATNDGAVAQLRQANTGSLTILSAAKGRQYSGESAQAGGGFFTEAIVDVLSEKRGFYDENNNGILEVVEFYRGVKTQVVSRTGEAQTPWLSRNQLVGENALF